MRAGGDFVDAQKFDYDAWKDALRPHWGWYSPQAIEHKAFAGIARLRSVCGFVGMDITCNAPRIERTQRDIRVDEVDHFSAVFQMAGRFKCRPHDRAVHPRVGVVARVDSARPVTYLVDDAYGQ